jgi:hypothetical protein
MTNLDVRRVNYVQESGWRDVSRKLRPKGVVVANLPTGPALESFQKVFSGTLPIPVSHYLLQQLLYFHIQTLTLWKWTVLSERKSASMKFSVRSD